MADTGVVIIGTGHGGAQAAIALRQRGYTGPLTLIGEEPDTPYERPPLSKDYLAGVRGFERILLRPESFWAERDVTLRLGQRAVAIRPDDHRVVLADGTALAYRHLIWAGGGSPRRLDCPGHDLGGVHYLRTRSDADRLRADLGEDKQGDDTQGEGKQEAPVVVIGGGYIGLEVAAVLRKAGRDVTIVEAQSRVLARVASPPLSDFFADSHRAQGVDVLCGTAVEALEGENGAVRAVRLADGRRIPAELVVVGIGILPEVAPLLSAGATGGADGQSGVWVDAQCATSLPDVFAIGDCALHTNPYASGALIRLESVQNAHDQAHLVARVIQGEADAQYDALPWFWSNQYDLKLQTVGLSLGYDDIVVRGRPGREGFSVVSLRAGRVIALDCVNCTRDFAQGRALVAAQAVVDRAALADPAVVLKSLLPQA